MAQPYDSKVSYKVLEKSLIGNEIFEAGQTVEWDGHPGTNMEPTCDEGRARLQKTLELNRENREKIARDYAPVAGLTPDDFMKAFRKELAESQASQAQVIAEAIAAAFERVTAAKATTKSGKQAAHDAV